jgi:hypothetical protein
MRDKCVGFDMIAVFSMSLLSYNACDDNLYRYIRSVTTNSPIKTVSNIDDGGGDLMMDPPDNDDFILALFFPVRFLPCRCFFMPMLPPIVEGAVEAAVETCADE